MKRLTIALTVVHNMIGGATIHEWQITFAFFATLLFYGLIAWAVQLLREQQPNGQEPASLPYGPDATALKHGGGEGVQSGGPAY
jgi:FtsH-binding integral membrane protein